MNFDNWSDTVEGCSALAHMTSHGVPPGLAIRILRAAFTSGQLSGRCEGMSHALESAVRASAERDAPKSPRSRSEEFFAGRELPPDHPERKP